MTETYQPPIESMTKALKDRELAPESNAALLNMLVTIERFGNTGLVSMDSEGTYSFISVPEKIAALMGGAAPKKEDFSFSPNDILILSSGERIPYSLEAFTEEFKRGGTPMLEISREDPNGSTRHLKLSLSEFQGNQVMFVQIDDETEKKLMEKLASKAVESDHTQEAANLNKQSHVAIDKALVAEMLKQKPSEEDFMTVALANLQEIVAQTSPAVIQYYPNAESSQLPAELLAQLKDISRDKFGSKNIAFPDNPNYDRITAVGTFPDTSSGDQKILGVFSKGTVSPALEAQLPYIMQQLKFAQEKLRTNIDLHRQLEQTSAELENAMLEARLDKLTSIPNRRWFIEKVLKDLSILERQLEALDAIKDTEARRIAENSIRIGLIFADIDKFKVFNEMYGHKGGDMVLSDTAQILYGEKRTEDFVARFGGEEFLMMMPGVDMNGLIIAANRHRTKISSEPLTFTDKDGKQKEQGITMSFGIVPMEILLKQTTLEDAREAMEDPTKIRFVSAQEVEDSKHATGEPGEKSIKIIQPDLIFDPSNPKKSLHDIKLLIAFERAHAIASQVNTLAKEAGRNRVFHAEWNETNKVWEANGAEWNEETKSWETPKDAPPKIINLGKGDPNPMIIQGSLADYQAALETEMERLQSSSNSTSIQV